MISPTCICSIGASTPSGVKLSCMALTEPLEAAVVATAHSAELPTPKRTSLPSMLPAELVDTAGPRSAGLPAISAQ